MCGIGGVIDEAGADPRSLQRLADALRHRGPDGEGVWTSRDGRIGLVHRRLAILDVSDLGRQPMESSDGRYVIVFNGEIYNFLELRAELQQRGCRFRSESDTEVILEAWRHWGEGMLLRFNGMWAFGILDIHTGELFLARDRFGIKPLYYAAAPGRFAFASEIRAIRTIPFADAGLDAEVATWSLVDSFAVEGTERTLFRGVRRLPGGHLARLAPGGSLKVGRWWRTTDHLPRVPDDPAEQADGFRERLTASIRLRMRSDVPLGTCLSGGFDSTAIASLLSRIGQEAAPDARRAKSWQHAFIASFPGSSNDETDRALSAAAYARIEPHVVVLKDADALEHIDRVLPDLDDIYLALPTAPWLIYRELRRAGVCVSLDGHGADELMGAYRQQGRALNFFAKNSLAALRSHRPGLTRALAVARDWWLRSRGLNFCRTRLSALAPLPFPADPDPLPPHWGALNRRLYQLFHSTLLPTILRNFDRMSMAHGIEVRMPFMDWQLVTYTMALPDAAKYQHGLSKYIARAALAGAMPESIRLDRRKVGFSSPMPLWLNGPLQAWVDALLARPNDEFDSLVDTRALGQKISQVNHRRAWTWELADRIWPYLHLKWLSDRLRNTS